MYIKKYTILLFIFYSYISNIYASKFPDFQLISNLDGLPSDIVTCISKDNHGYIWFGTEGGLVRYNGYEYKSYSSLEVGRHFPFSENINTILPSEKGEVFVSNIKSIYLFDSNTEQAELLHTLNSVNTKINHFTKWNDFLWIASSDGLISYNLKNKKIKKYNKQKLLRKDIRKVYIHQDKLWVLYTYGDLSVVDLQTMNLYHLSYDAPETKRTFVSFYAEDDRTYMGLWESGVFEVSLRNDSIYATPTKSDIISDVIVLDIKRDNEYGYYWLSTTIGIFVVDNIINPTFTKHFKATGEKGGINNEEIWNSYYDEKEQILWFGSYGGGVYKLPLTTPIIRHHKLLDIKSQFGSNTVSAIYDDSNYMYLGLEGAVLAIKDKKNNTISHYSKHPQLRRINTNANGVNVITPINSRNELWFATRYLGIWIAKKDKLGNIVSVNALHKLFPQIATFRDTKHVFQDSRGGIWVDHNLGLTYLTFKDNKIEKYRFWSITNKTSPFFNKEITGIAQCGEGKMWFSTKNNGIICVDNFEMDNLQNYLVGDKPQITSIICDAENNIWVTGKGFGLAKYDHLHKKFTKVDQSVITFANAYNLIQDNNGLLWFATEKGLVSYDHLNNFASLLTVVDGLPSNLFLHGSSTCSQEGLIYAGGYSGLTEIDLEIAKRNVFIPSVRISDVLMSDKSIVFESTTYGSCVERDEKTKDITSIRIKPGDVSLSIEVTPLSFISPSKNLFKYKLNGHKKEYSYLSGVDNVLRFDNLAAGQYELEVWATNNDLCWSSKPLLVKIIVESPWYATDLAYIFYILICFLIFAIIVWQIENRMSLNQALRIARLDEGKNREVNAAKLNFFTNVSHELLTPLSIISCGVDEIGEDFAQNEKVKLVIKNSSTRLLNLIRQILEFRKAETGNLKLQVSKGNLVSFVRNISLNSFMPLLQSKRLTLDFISSLESITGWFDPDKLEKILSNLLSNAIKYNIEGGQIKVNFDVSEDRGKIIIKVFNTGGYISPDRMKELFSRFYDGDYRRFETHGVGIGLSLTKDLVDLHHGEITVESQENIGTTFIVILPITKDTFFSEVFDEADEEFSPVMSYDHTDGEIYDEDQAAYDQNSDENLKDIVILIVEDDPDLLSIVEKSLMRHYNILTAKNGLEALEVLTKHNVDIVVSDVLMPQMGGYELCAAIKNNVNISHIPVILLTARVAVDSHIEGYDSGADAYLTKPVNFKLLRSRIGSVLSNRALLKEKFKFNNLELSQIKSVTTLDETFLKKAISVIEDNLDNSDFDNKMFLEQMSVTNSTLYRKLKALVNLSPNEFIRHVRLKAAYRIIEEKKGVIFVSELAYAVGFTTPYYFTNCFKKEFGITPAQLIANVTESAIESTEA